MLHTRLGEIVIVTANLPFSSNKFLSRSLTVILSVYQSGRDVLAHEITDQKNIETRKPLILLKVSKVFLQIS